MGDFCCDFESLPRQLTQLLSKFNRRGIRPGTGVLVPPAQLRAQSCREEVLNRLVDSGRVSPFKHLIKIVCGDQGMDPAQVLGNIARLNKVAVITLLQLCVFKVHEASLSGGWVKMAGRRRGSGAPDGLVRCSCGHASLTVRVHVPTALPLSA